jgi:chromate transporter
VFVAALRLGLTSFGGPVAHLGYFEREYVARRRWVDERTYADLVALSQFLPGPASSQVGMAVGLQRAGLLGGVAAWLGFTLPSAVLLYLFAQGIEALGPSHGAGWLHGLAVAAVAVVALALWGMAQKLCPDPVRGTIAVAAAVATIAWPGGLQQIAVLLAGAVAGSFLCRTAGTDTGGAIATPIRRRHALVALAVFGILLVGLPAAAAITQSEALAVGARFYRTGSLVFGGGHVVLPLLEADVVATGWTTSEKFLAGYGAAQAVPGPLLTISAYLGAVIGAGPGGAPGAALALVAIFLPSYLLVVGALPFWARLRASPGCQAALRGTNAAVVGLLLATLYDPVWTSAVRVPADFGLALAAFAALALWRCPPWIVVVVTSVAGRLLAV